MLCTSYNGGDTVRKLMSYTRLQVSTFQMFASFLSLLFFLSLHSVLSSVQLKCFQCAALVDHFAIHFCTVTLLQSSTEVITWAVHCIALTNPILQSLPPTDSPWLCVLLCDTVFMSRQCRLGQPQEFDPFLGAGICRPNLNKFSWVRHCCCSWS